MLEPVMKKNKCLNPGTMLDVRVKVHSGKSGALYIIVSSIEYKDTQLTRMNRFISDILQDYVVAYLDSNSPGKEQGKPCQLIWKGGPAILEICIRRFYSLFPR